MEVKVVDRKVRVYVGTAYREYQTHIEALLEEIQLFLNYKVKHRGTVPLTMAVAAKINAEQVARIKRGRIKIPQDWLLRLHVWSGMPLQDIEQLAGTVSDVQPHRSL